MQKFSIIKFLTIFFLTFLALSAQVAFAERCPAIDSNEVDYCPLDPTATTRCAAPSGGCGTVEITIPSGQDLNCNTCVLFTPSSGGGGGSGGGGTSMATGTAGEVLYFGYGDNKATGTPVLYVNEDGTIGVGTTTSTSTLSIFGSINLNGDIIDHWPTGSGAGFGVDAGTYAYYNDGFLGLGTSNPSRQLTVIGGIENYISTSSDISEIAGTSLNSPASIYVSGKYLYTANYSDDSISITDISNPKLPMIIGTTSVGQNPKSIYVSGRYAYVANSGDDTVTIVDISDSKNPTSTASVSVEKTPNSIYVSGKHAYVANKDSDSISILDVSDPINPVQIATTSVGSEPSSIYVLGSYAYVANEVSKDISVIDISSSSNPIQVGLSAVVGVNLSAIYVSGRYAYVADNGSNEISVIDISNPISPWQVATTSVGNNPSSIYVSGGYAYVTNSGDGTISVVDVSAPSAPIEVAITNVGDSPRSVFVSGGYAYIGNFSSDTLSVVDLGGVHTGNLIAGAIETGNIQIANNLIAQGNITARTSLNVGSGGIMSDGPVSVNGSITLNGQKITSWPIGGSTDGCLGSVYVGTTTPTLGDVGSYVNVQNLCNSQFAGSHACSESEMYKTMACGVSLPTNDAYWINGGLSSTEEAITTDCSTWTSSSSDTYGKIWDGLLEKENFASCDLNFSFICCK